MKSYEYRELSMEAWFCVCSVDRDCGWWALGTGGLSPIGGTMMGGRTGREEGIMYSDSSSLSRASSPVPVLKAEVVLGTQDNYGSIITHDLF